MTRLNTRLSPPHAIPRCLPRSVAPRPSTERKVRKRSSIPQRLALLAALIGGASVATGCGRTELDFGDSEYDVAAAREVMLEDESMVYVELIAPADPDATSALFVIEDGTADLDEVVDSICPGEEPDLLLDFTSDLPVIEVTVEGELRAVIWN